MWVQKICDEKLGPVGAVGTQVIAQTTGANLGHGDQGLMSEMAREPRL
jgi:hypothetical protein